MFDSLGYSIAYNPRTDKVSKGASTTIIGDDFGAVVELILEHDRAILP